MLTMPLLATAASSLALALAPASSQPSAPRTASGSGAVPAADHHLHLPGPAGIEVLTPTPLRPVEQPLPEELTALLERRTLQDIPTVEFVSRLYTSDAVVRSRRGGGWVGGAVTIARALSDYSPGYRLVPVAYEISGDTGYVAGYFARGERFNATFQFVLRREEGEWRIAVDNIIPEAPTMDPPRISAEELIAELDEAGIRFGVIHSVGYFYGSPLFIGDGDEEAAMREENDWTARQAMKYPDRLVAFCGVNPLKDYAVREIERCSRLPGMAGVKLHFGNSGVALRDPDHLRRVKAVFAAAERLSRPVAVHMEELKDYGREQAEIFLEELLPSAPAIPVQIMHMGGAGPGYSRDPAFAVLAGARESGDPRVQNLWVDVASNAVASSPPDNLELIARRLRQFGLERVLFGSDRVPGMTNEDPATAWASFQRLPLRQEELRSIADNVAPYLPGRQR